MSAIAVELAILAGLSVLLYAAEDSVHCQVTNTPPAPKIGPEHIEALGVAIEAMSGLISDLNATIVYCNKGLHSRASADHYAARLKSAERYAARLAEIRAYLESL